MAMLSSVTIALVMLGLAAVGQPTPKGLANEQLLAAIAAEDGLYDDAFSQDESNVGDADALSLLQKEGVYLYRKAPSAAEVPVQRARVQYYGEDELSVREQEGSHLEVWEDDVAFVQTGAQVLRPGPAGAAPSAFAVDAVGEVTHAAARAAPVSGGASGVTAISVSAEGHTVVEL
mmetsp:Transcript_90009/g.234325  ORF Transcript_90009/g.234325 Transcript_90009/m.234325 type:complete len:175 (-) Transcript_90009:81-605(-)